MTANYSKPQNGDRKIRYMAQDYYQLLGIRRSATHEDINKAYRRQMRLWRNRLNAPDLELRQEAERMLVNLDRAKKALLNGKRDGGNYHKRQAKTFSLFDNLKNAPKIVVKGLYRALQHLLLFILAIVTGILKFVFKLLVVLFVGLQLIIGFSGLWQFIEGVQSQTMDLAAIGLACNYFSMSVVAFMFYYDDKKKAQRGQWRTQESTLHYLELGGGWLGAFLGQVFLRHKSSKESFQLVYWLIVLFHCSLWLFFIPASFPYAIAPRNILIVNIVLLLVALNAISRKGKF